MKTQDEIEEIKNKLGEKISELSSDISNCNDVQCLIFMSERSRQLQAQYNIILEILK